MACVACSKGVRGLPTARGSPVGGKGKGGHRELTVELNSKKSRQKLHLVLKETYKDQTKAISDSIPYDMTWSCLLQRCELTGRKARRAGGKEMGGGGRKF